MSPIKPTPKQPLTASNTVVELKRASKWYRRGEEKTVVLDEVDFRVQAGECVFLLGPSGSGKTTLLSLIGCVLSADAGDVRVLGHNPRQLDAQQLALLRRDHIGFVFQRFHLIRGLSALENVAVPLLLRGYSHAQANRAAREKLDVVGLGSYHATSPTRMSVGQCQRVAFARALVGDPQLILADEPTASLDGDTGQRAMELLRAVTAEASKTVVVVTHDHRILPFADRIVQMQRGTLVDAQPAPTVPVVLPATFSQPVSLAAE